MENRESPDCVLKKKKVMSYAWYSKQLGISVSTAKRYGKELLMHMFKEKRNNIQENLPFLLEEAFKNGEKKFIKNLPSYVFFDFDEDKVNEETRKIGIDLLNKTLKSLSAIVDEDNPNHQRAYMLLGISKMILGVR